MSSTLVVAVSPMSRNYDPSDKLLKDGKEQLPFVKPRDSNGPKVPSDRRGHRSPAEAKVGDKGELELKELTIDRRHSSADVRRPRRSSSQEVPRIQQGAVEKGHQKLSESSFSSLGSDSSADEERKVRRERRVNRSSLSKSQHCHEEPRQVIESRRASISTQQLPRRSSSVETPRQLQSSTEKGQTLDLTLPSEGEASNLRTASDHIKFVEKPSISLTRQRSLDDLVRLARKSTRSPPNNRTTDKDFKLEADKLKGLRTTLARPRVRENLKTPTETGGRTMRGPSQRPPRYRSSSSDDVLRDSGHDSGSLGSSMHESASSFDSDHSVGRYRGLLTLNTKNQLWEELKAAPEKQGEPSRQRKAASPVASILATKSALERVMLDTTKKQGSETFKNKVALLERQDSTGSLTLDDLGLEGGEMRGRDPGYPSADSSRNAGKVGSMTTNSFIATNALGGSVRQYSMPTLESVVSFGDSFASNASQLSILREGKFSKSRLHSSRSSLISTLSEPSRGVSFAGTVTIINEVAPGRLLITRRQLPQAGPAIKTDTAYGHQQPRLFPNRAIEMQSSSPPFPQPKASLAQEPAGRQENRARRNSLELVKTQPSPPPATAQTPPIVGQVQMGVAFDQQQQQQQQLAAVKQARQAKANAAFASFGGMLQPR